MTTTYYFTDIFTKLGVGTVPSAEPLIDVVNCVTGSLVVSGSSSPFSIANMAGLYTYSYTGADNLLLIAKLYTTDETMDSKVLYSKPDLIYRLIGSDGKAKLSTDAQTGVTIPTVTTLTNAPSDSSGVTEILTRVPDATPGASGGLPVLNASLEVPKVKALTDAPADSSGITTILADYARRTDVVTSIAVSATTAASVSTGSIAITTFYTLQQSVSSTTTSDLSSATKLWFAIKRNIDDDDDSSLIFIEETAGLTIVNGAAHETTTDGSLTVTGESGDWDIAIHIEEAVTGLLPLSSSCHAAVKALISGDTVDVWSGTASISYGIIEAVS